MKCILLSGGSGQRLWPLSNDARSKQFLKILRAPDQSMESMVQRVWRQIAEAGLASDCYITTSLAQLDILHNQLGGQVPVIVEPERRDTFPAIALACVFLHDREQVSADEFVCILPVDPYVDDAFFRHIGRLEQTAEASGADIVLMGVKPTYPSAKYGYIVPGPADGEKGCAADGAEGAADHWPVGHFIEKPTELAAEALIAQGALWNCGVFGFRLGFMIDWLEQRGLPIQYEALLAGYADLKRSSFDYEVLESASNLAVLPYGGSWKDLGTWNTLTEEVGDPIQGKGWLSDDSYNTHIINELSLPVAVLGLSNAVVAVSPDGILVSDKPASARLKQWTSRMAAQRPMQEERRWGWHRILDQVADESGQDAVTRRFCLYGGHHITYRVPEALCITWTVISGTGESTRNGDVSPVGPGSVIRAEGGEHHGLRAAVNLELIAVQVGPGALDAGIICTEAEWALGASHHPNNL